MERRKRKEGGEGIELEGAVCTAWEVSQGEELVSYVCQSNFDLLPLIQRRKVGVPLSMLSLAPCRAAVGVGAAVIDYDNHDADVAKSREREGDVGNIRSVCAVEEERKRREGEWNGKLEGARVGLSD